MIASRIHNTGSSLGAPSRGNFYSVETVFDLQVGADYHVLGLGIFSTVLLDLVYDETGKPNWLPVGLFDFLCPAMPTGWEART